MINDASNGPAIAMRGRQASAVLVLGSLLLLGMGLLPSSAHGQATAKIPNFVLKDGGGEVMGRVVGFGSLGDIFLAMEDPGFDNDIPMNVNFQNGEVHFEGPRGRVYYSGSNCSGTAHVQQASEAENAMTRFLGRAYEAGPSPGGGGAPNTDIIIYRGQPGPPISAPTILSRFSGNTCLASGDFGETMVVADQIIDVTTQFGSDSTWTLE